MYFQSKNKNKPKMNLKRCGMMPLNISVAETFDGSYLYKNTDKISGLESMPGKQYDQFFCECPCCFLLHTVLTKSE